MKTIIFALIISSLSTLSFANDAIETAIYTKLTHIDLNGDNRPDYIRKFDRSGELIYYKLTPPRREGYKEVFRRKKDISTTKYYQNNKLYKKLIENFPQESSPIATTLEGYHAKTKSFHKKSVSEIIDFQERIQHFTFKNQRWQLISTQFKGLFSHKGKKKKRKRQSKTPTENYIKCLKRDKSIHGDCFEELQNLISLESLDINKWNNLRCEEKKKLFLPNGFKIDLKTCKDQEMINLIEETTNKVIKEKLRCLNSINPNLAANFIVSMQKNRSPIYCIQTTKDMCKVINKDFLPWYKTLLCKKPLFKDTTIAMTMPKLKHKPIFITSSLDQLKQDPLGAQEILTSALFHEALHHVADSSERHNDPNHSTNAITKRSLAHDDAVYGCENLCAINNKPSPIPEALTIAGCTACLSAAGNTFNKKQNACTKIFNSHNFILSKHLNCELELRAGLQSPIFCEGLPKKVLKQMQGYIDRHPLPQDYDDNELFLFAKDYISPMTLENERVTKLSHAKATSERIFASFPSPHLLAKAIDESNYIGIKLVTLSVDSAEKISVTSAPMNKILFQGSLKIVFESVLNHQCRKLKQDPSYKIKDIQSMKSTFEGIAQNRKVSAENFQKIWRRSGLSSYPTKSDIEKNQRDSIRFCQDI